MNTFEYKWQEKIEEATWYVSGYSSSSVTPSTFQNAESTGTTWTGKIGLMYISDYGFASDSSTWTSNIGSYNSSSIRDNNWMYMGLSEWTISRDLTTTYSAFVISSNGNGVSGGDGNVRNSSIAVWTVFYLNSDVEYASGSGTQSDPYRIKID